MLFTFAGLVEYCVILGIIRSHKLKHDQNCQENDDKQLKAKCARIDRTFARIIKPLFVVFILVHWIIAAYVYF